MEAFVAKPARRGHRRSLEQIDRLPRQAQLASTGRERVVGAGDRAGGADASSRRYLEVACVDAARVVRKFGSPQRTDDSRSTIQDVEREAGRKTKNHVNPTGTREGRQAPVWNLLREAHVG